MRTFWRILEYGKPYGSFWTRYLLLSILSLLFGVMNYALLGPLLTVLFENENIAVGVAAPEFSFSVDYFIDLFRHLLSTIVMSKGMTAALLFVCLAIVVTCFFSDLCRYLSQRIIVSVKTRLMKNVRADLFRKISTLDVGALTDRKKGDILSSVLNDVNEVQNSVAGSFHIVFREPVLVAGFLGMLFYMSPKLTAVSLVALPLCAIFVTRLTRKLRAGSSESQSLMGTITSHFEEAVSGLRIIKAFGAVKYVNDNFEKSNDAHRKISRSVSNRQEMASPTSEFLGISIAAVVLFYGGWLNMRGQLGMNWQEFIVYIMFYWKVLEPAKAIANSYAGIQKGIASGERIFAVLDIPSRVTDGNRKLSEVKESIRFENVSFAYEDIPVLKNVSFEIPKGKMVALVGPSGAGKSTAADLLPRFWDVRGGRITIDGIDIREFLLEDLTSLMGIVTQDTILFNDTVFNNIAFGMKGVSRDDVISAARTANAEEFILQLPEGYDTNIGDGGTRLSGGQRQRIAIARAVLKNPPVLILDEATSALDTENERIVQNALVNLMANRTSLVIAHRLSTIREADKILVLQEGTIVESGKHDELLAKDGVYSHLCRIQNFR